MPEMTKLANLVNPEVMADMVSARLPKKIKFSPIAKIDTPTKGNQPCNPQFLHILTRQVLLHSSPS